MEMMLQTQNLCKYFRKQKAVNNVSLNIEKGQIYGLLGPNGAGKSTTLKMLTGMMKPTAGKIYFDGKLLDRKDLSKIGALIENPPIYENLSARENLKVRQLLLGTDENRIDEVLQIVSLTNTGKKKAGQFSLGMKQRLGIAMALLGEPELLILDEPTNGLDPIGIEELRELIRSFPEQGITVILSSHILSEVQLLADKVGIISGGILGYEGALKQGDNLEDLFMNVVRKTRKQVKSMVNIIKAEHQKAKRTMTKKVYLGISSSYICHGIYIYSWDDKCLCRKCLELVVYTFAAGDDCSILLSFCGAGEKDKILSFNDYSHRQKKIVAGENYLYWVHDFVF